ncbi:insulin-like peptide INSL5 [Hyperolius riggenbachi]|uniref:insulin-like peptide INSL5 n=1 Tax=Hyperolius riggenbachi TaxID=752182 RepID=UPI0035A35B5A
MRALAVSCVLLILLVAAENVRGDGQYVKLCGREFIRAVIYTCGGSRWRRLLPENPQDVAVQGNFFAFHAGDDSMESGPQDHPAQKMDSQLGYEDLQQTGSFEEVWESQKKNDQERRDLDELLTTACCRTGCKKKDLSSLC